MRVLAACILAFGLVAVPAMPKSGGSGDDTAAAKAAATAKANDATAAKPKATDPSAPAAKAVPPATPEISSMESELQELRDLITAQSKQIQAQSEQLKDEQQKMQALEDQLNAASAARATVPASPAPAASGAEAVSAPVSQPAIPGAPSMSSSSRSASRLAATSPASALNSPAPAAAQKPEEKLGPIAFQDFKIGATFLGDFTHYTDTGFGPQWYDNAYQLGPGNNGENVFEVTRTYINLFYSPNEHVTLRFTPDIYRELNGTQTAISAGTGSTIGATQNGNLTFRLKYAFVDFQKYFGDGAFKDTKITFGQTQQPLTDWEEGLYGYRYSALTPWNYASLSSTYTGAKIHGPILFNGKEYLDYDLGVFNTASFHAFETNDKKQGMVRLTVYPFGTTSDRTGLGATFFEDYGYNTKFPSQISTPNDRLAVIVFYQTHNKAYQLAGEYDWGRNAFSTGNLFSGDAPTAVTAGDQFATFSSLAGTILGGTHTHQQGFDFFGHARLGNSPFSAFGLFQYFNPNTVFDYATLMGPTGAPLTNNPLDFTRTVGGISYSVTKNFDFAVGDENFHWLYPQGVVVGGDTNGIAIWTQFNF